MARVVVTGGAGFVGSHLCEALLARGDEVVAVDNLSTCDGSNIAELESRRGFSFVEADVTEALPVKAELSGVVHLASPASPADFFTMPLQTLAAGSRGTENCLVLAETCGARFVLASTSEVYGDALVHPQPESYFGNVDSVGPRSAYDEAKRFAEALTVSHARTQGIDAGIVRIFNTYGPRLRPHDGRVVPNFIVQALSGRPLTIHGDGTQTRSFCYVDDIVAGLCSMLDASGVAGPVNLGNPSEVTIRELAYSVLACTGSASGVVHEDPSPGDPVRRCPDVRLAAELLGWQPSVPLVEGLARTVEWFRARLA